MLLDFPSLVLLDSMKSSQTVMSDSSFSLLHPQALTWPAQPWSLGPVPGLACWGGVLALAR